MINNPYSGNQSVRQRVVTSQPREGNPRELELSNASGRGITTRALLQSGVVSQQPARDVNRMEPSGLPISSLQLMPQSVRNVSEEPATNGCGSCCSGHRPQQPATLLPGEQQTAVADTAPKEPDCCEKFWCCCCTTSKQCWYNNCTAEGLEKQGPDMTRCTASLCCFICADIAAATGVITQLLVHKSLCGFTSGGAMGGATAGIIGGSLTVAGSIGCCIGCCCYNCCAQAAIQVNEAEGWENKVDMMKEAALMNLYGAGSSDKKKKLTDEERKEKERQRANRKITFKEEGNDLNGLKALVEEGEGDASSSVHAEHQGIPKLRF
ncbi:MAG: hypothetical protein ACRC24_07980 [Vibrionaceae bacterium]